MQNKYNSSNMFCNFIMSIKFSDWNFDEVLYIKYICKTDIWGNKEFI